MKVVVFIWYPHICFRQLFPSPRLGSGILSGKLGDKYSWCFNVIVSKKWLH